MSDKLYRLNPKYFPENLRPVLLANEWDEKTIEHWLSELFVELDLQHLHQQIEDLARPLFVGGREGSTRWVDEDGLNKFVDRIVTLITQGEKE